MVETDRWPLNSALPFLPGTWLPNQGTLPSPPRSQLWLHDYYSAMGVSRRDEGYFQSLGLKTRGWALPHPISLRLGGGGDQAEP